MSQSVTDPAVPKAAAWLGWAGVLPFLAMLLLAVLGKTPEQRALGLKAFVAYSVVISSFLGGVRWGAALPAPQLRRLTMAVMPALIAFMLLLIPPADALRFLALLFIVLAIFDVARGSHALWPAWFKRQRLHLSVAVVTLHLVLLYLWAG